MKAYVNGITFTELDGEDIAIVHHDAKVKEFESYEQADKMLFDGEIEDYLFADGSFKGVIFFEYDVVTKQIQGELV